MSVRMKRKDQRRKQTIAVKILIVLIIGFLSTGLIYKVGQNLYTVLSKNRIKTADIKYGSLEDLYQGQGLVLRSEKTIQAPANGRFENYAGEQEKVRRLDLLGYYITISGKTAIRTSASGIFTRRVDGLESALQNVNLQSVGPEVFKYQPLSADPGDEIKAGQPFCKIINNLIPSQLLLCIPLENEKISVEKDQIVQLKVDGEALGDFTVLDCKRDFNSLLILVEADQFREELLNKRCIEVEMAVDANSGYLVPEKSVINRGKEKGIYCIKSEEEIIFKPVKVLKIKNDIAVIEGLNPTDIIIVNPEAVGEPE